MEDWGDIRVEQITVGRDVWALILELYNDNSGFIHNIPTILNAFKAGNLYGLKVNETQAMYDKHSGLDPIWRIDSFYQLPCFCIREDNTAIIIWTHTRARRLGFGRILVQKLGITKADNVLTESVEFWKSCGIRP